MIERLTKILNGMETDKFIEILNRFYAPVGEYHLFKMSEFNDIIGNIKPLYVLKMVHEHKFDNFYYDDDFWFIGAENDYCSRSLEMGQVNCDLFLSDEDLEDFANDVKEGIFDDVEELQGLNAPSVDEIKEILFDMDNYELMDLWNSYCEKTHNENEKVYDIDYFDDVFDLYDYSSVSEILDAFEYMDRNDKFFNADKDTTDNVADIIDISDIADYISENLETFGNADLQEFCGF